MFLKWCSKNTYKGSRKRKRSFLTLRESASSPYKWQEKTFIERVILVPQYSLAYSLLFDIYIIHLVVVRFYSIPFILIAILDLFGDGTTYTQLAFLYFTFGVVISAIWIRPFFRQPKTVTVVL